MTPCESCPINELSDTSQKDEAAEGYRIFNKGYITESELFTGRWCEFAQAIIDCGEMRKASPLDEVACDFVRE